MTARRLKQGLRPQPSRLRGLTLVELMVSLALGLLVILVTTGLLLSTKTGYLMQDDEALMNDSARHAMELVARAIRQAAYEDWGTEGASWVAQETMSANIAGLNARRLSAVSPGLDSPSGAGVVNGSDVLAVRFFGSGASTGGDGTMLNCAGFAVGEPTSAATASDDRGWSIFYVGTSSGQENVLYCKYKGAAGAWTAQAIAAGVESFQVLYGVDIDKDGMPDRYMHAGAVDALDAGLALDGADAAAQAADFNRKTHWKRVVVVRVALLMQGAHNVRADVGDEVYDLFGAAYSDSFAGSDPGVRIDEAALAASVRNRARRLFTATIQLRNRSAGSAA